MKVKTIRDYWSDARGAVMVDDETVVVTLVSDLGEVFFSEDSLEESLKPGEWVIPSLESEVCGLELSPETVEDIQNFLETTRQKELF